MVTYKGCQIVLLGGITRNYAVKSKLYKNAYIGLGNYEDCKATLSVSGSHLKLLEQETSLTYSRLDGKTIPEDKLELITMKGNK